MVTRIDRLESSVLGPVPVFDRWKRVRRGPAAVELARDCEHGVADRLGGETAAIETPEPPIARVNRGVRAVVLARQPVGARQQDLAVQILDRPAASDQSGGQPVEKLGMAGRLTANAEVGRGRDDAPAEVMLPDPVGDHPGG